MGVKGGRWGGGGGRYLHPEEGDAGQEIHGRLQVLEALGISCWEIILRREKGGGGVRRVRRRTGGAMTSCWEHFLKHQPSTQHTSFRQNIEIDYGATPSNHNKMTVCLIV